MNMISVTSCNEGYVLFLVISCGLLFILCIILAVACFVLWKNKTAAPEAYAECMADTYLYGYLKKIVPDREIGDGLKDRIMRYKCEHNLTHDEFPFEKMFVLIPHSGYIPSLLTALEPNRLELRQSLKPTTFNRAGVNQRKYQTSVYKVSFRGDPSKHISVVMEGAPPLLCLSDSCKENAELRKHKHDLIRLFYEKLKAKIEETPEFEDACELMYYDDSKTNLADSIILRYLEGA